MGRYIQYLWQKVIYTTSILTVAIVLCTYERKETVITCLISGNLKRISIATKYLFLCTYLWTTLLFCQPDDHVFQVLRFSVSESARLVVSASISITMKNKFSDKRNNVHIRWITCKSKQDIRYKVMIVEPVPFIHFAWDRPRNLIEIKVFKERVVYPTCQGIATSDIIIIFFSARLGSNSNACNLRMLK